MIHISGMLNCYRIDAFTSKVFGGNTACVIPLENWLSDLEMLQLAGENNVAETAFFISTREGFHIRWFTPEIEMDLCGHATLATAHVIKRHLGFQKSEIYFSSASGPLKVMTKDDQYILDFPSRPPIPTVLPEPIAQSLNLQPAEVFKARDYVLLYDNEEQIYHINPDKSIMDQVNIDPGGVIVTAAGTKVDFVSRFFTPQASIFEDPVTGSAHCSLVPFWSQRLKKKSLHAWQISARKGELFCTDEGDRVLIGGHAVTFSHGVIDAM